MTITKAIIKVTPIHCVVSITATGAETGTIALATDLLYQNAQLNQEVVGGSSNATPPIVNIMGIYWSVPGVAGATVVRGADTLWTLAGAYKFDFRGWADNRDAQSDIAVTFPSAGTVIFELLKVSGYNNTQHYNPLT